MTADTVDWLSPNKLFEGIRLVREIVCRVYVQAVICIARAESSVIQKNWKLIVDNHSLIVVKKLLPP